MEQPNFENNRWDTETHRSKRGHYISEIDIEDVADSHFDLSNPVLNEYYVEEVEQANAKSKVRLALDTIPAQEVVSEELSDEARQVLQARADFLEEVTGLTAKERKEIMEEEVKS